MADEPDMNWGTLDKYQEMRIVYQAKGAAYKAMNEANEQTVQNKPNSAPSGSQESTAFVAKPIELPTISKIFGSGSNIKVKLIYSNGSETVNRVGDLIGDDLKITSISINGVKALQIKSGNVISIN